MNDKNETVRNGPYQTWLSGPPPIISDSRNVGPNNGSENRFTTCPSYNLGRRSPGIGTGDNFLGRGIVMDQSSATGTAVEFGVESLKSNAALYAKNKRLVDAVAAKYDSVDDAIAALQSVEKVLVEQIENGSGCTPDRSLGFGSDNASQIAEKILGLGTSDADTRKSFASLGK